MLKNIFRPTMRLESALIDWRNALDDLSLTPVLSNVVGMELCISLDQLLKKLEVDRSVALVLGTKIWQLIAGPVSIILISRYFSPEVQGFYYTFASLLAMQTFVELAFRLVIVSLASHEWSRLRLDSEGGIAGEAEARSRLVSLGRLSGKWYLLVSLVFVAAVGTAGFTFFSQEPNPSIHWQAPWLFLVVVSGMSLLALPFISLLEGCNQVATINQFRVTQAVLSSLALWGTIALGGQLWVCVVSAVTSLMVDLYLLIVRFRHFFRPFFIPPEGSRVEWRIEIWPMQWRLALLGGVNFFMYSLFNPVMFHYYGAVVAGQMGMTWQILGALQGVALAWLSTKVPFLGMLIAQKQYAELDRIWLRASLIGITVMSLGGMAVWICVYWLNVMQMPLANRLLLPLPTALFLAATILMMIVQSLATYLRAHKKEPLAALGVISGLAIGTLVWLLGSRFGATGAALAYFLVLLMITVPMTMLIWFRSREEWHKF